MLKLTWLIFIGIFLPVFPDETQTVKELYKSSDAEKEWPQPGHSWTDAPDTWPGHLQQLGSQQPRAPVQVHPQQGFPRATEFYNDYVNKKKPVVFHEGIESMGLTELILEKLNHSGLAPLAFIDFKDMRSKEHRRTSMRTFIKNLENPVHMLDNLHPHFKKQVTLPRCLVCSYLVPLLEETRHTVINRHFSGPLLKDNSDIFTCLVDGKKEVLLIDTRKFPEVDNVLDVEDQKYGKSSSMNSLQVDYTKYPEAAKVSLFHIANLKSGDCLYIPSGWISQTNVFGLENSVEIRWRSSAWEPDDECMKSISNKAPLSQFNFPGENSEGIDPSLDKEGKVLKKLWRVLGWMTRDNITKKTLDSKLSMDPEIVPDIKLWNAECSERSAEMFELLDLNKDEKLGPDDLSAVSEDIVPRLVGYMEDRIADLQDIAADQKLSIPKRRNEDKNDRTVKDEL